MDLRKTAVNDTAFVHFMDANDNLLYEKKTVPNPDGEGTIEIDDPDKPVGVTVYGPGSKAFAKANAAKQNRLLDRLKKKGKADLTAAENIEETATFLAAITKSTHYIEIDELQGEALAKAIYSDTTIGFYADQVNEKIKDWGNFTQPSPKG